MKKLPKFKSAEEKRLYLENQKSWEKLKAKYEPKRNVPKSSKVLVYSLENPPGRERLELPSRDTGLGVATSRDSVKYTGDKMIGVSIIHKSCLQPIFNEQAAKDAAGMRR